MSAGANAFVGRDEELRVLDDLLDRSKRANSGLLLQVVGEPGIGKSRLLRELAARGAARGHLVLSGRAAEYEAELPFGVFGDALDDWLVRQNRRRLAELADDAAGELAIVFAAFERVAGARERALEQERYRAYRAVRALLAALAAREPLALVLDDVQWADPGSIELLCHLLAHPPPGKVLVALGFRAPQLPSRLGRALAASLREPDATRLELAPLSQTAAHTLLGSQMSRAGGDRLYRASGGNPFFLLQLARSQAWAPALANGDAEVGSHVPAAVRAALASELSSLSAPARALLQGAAVAGDPFDARLAAGAGEVGENAADDLLEELLGFGLIHPGPSAGVFAFRHPIVRATVYELAGTGWRAQAHARVARLLADAGASAAAQAPHLERSSISGDRGAVDVLVAAGAASAARTPALAARWYAAALRLLPETDDDEPRRIEVMIALATALGAAGRLEESRRTLCDVLERLPALAPARVPVVAYCAGVEHLLGRHRDAHARLSRAHARADADSVEAILLKLELAAGAGYENRAKEMLRWATQAQAATTGIDRRPLAVAAAGQVALARYFLGHAAWGDLDRAAAGLDALDDGELATRLDLGLWVGWTEAVLERSEQAIEHCRRVVDVSRATGQGATLLVTMTALAWALIRLGRLAEAEAILAAATESGSLAPNLFLAVAFGLSSVVATQQGRLPDALRAGEQSVRLARSADPGLIPGMSGLFLATPLIELGRARRAREVILATSGGSELRTSRSGHTAAYEVLTRADLALGRPDAAAAWAAKAQAATHGGDLAIEAAFAQRAVAAVALARGEAAEAARIALGAAARVDEARAPVEAARCRILAAGALAQAGDRGRAIAVLEHADDDLGRTGAEGYRPQATQALQRLRHGERRGPGTKARVQRAIDLRCLTERQRQIAQLVHSGATNHAIAAALFVSEKTVERELSRIFAALGMARRTELALALAATSRRA